MAEAEPGRLLLWDIDGTLLGADDVDDEIFDRAIERTLGLRPPTRVSMGGKTDPQITMEYLAMLAVPEPELHVATVLDHLRDEMAAAQRMVRQRDRVLPGVAEVLARLAGHDEVVQTVLTGNIAANALVKLAAFGLDVWVDLTVGAFGSDHAERDALVPIAVDRVAVGRGVRFGPEQIWVIGDTAHDLACAGAFGARCLLVGTGRLGFEAVRALGADAAVADLSDVDSVVRLLTG